MVVAVKVVAGCMGRKIYMHCNFHCIILIECPKREFSFYSILSSASHQLLFGNFGA